MPTDTLRERRGHDFYLWPADMPRADDPATDVPDPVIWLHYFGPSQDWWISGADPDTGMAFGFARLFEGTGEWGSIYLPELEEVLVHSGLTIIERDCHWEPKRFSEIKA